jgi:hypothetical protein
LSLLEGLKVKSSLEEERLESFGKYAVNCEEVIQSGKQGLDILKNARLSEIAEAIRNKLESEK